MSPALTRPLAVTLGDPAGIGPEIIAKAFRDAPELLRGCFVVGHVPTLRRACALLAREADECALPVVTLESVDEVLGLPPRCLPVWSVPRAADGQPDLPFPLAVQSAAAGRMAGDCVTWAAEAALRGQVAAMVTAPLNKASLSLAGAPYSAFAGHTELLQSLAARHVGLRPDQCPVRMMLANDELRVVLVSIHLALRDALAAVTVPNLQQTLLITHQALQTWLGRPPRIGVAGLNPHAGEGGLFGDEEQRVILPAVRAARELGVLASDPQPPDTVFMRARHGAEFDVVVAMYHDQGLIPVKYLGVDKGVNITLGLPWVRTSPDHGTAFDLAGTGRADASSLIHAVRMARELVQRQQAPASV